MGKLANKKMIKVSVIMPVFNAEKYLEDAIKSVLSQTYKNIELVIVNDGSIDNTESIVQKYLDNKNIVYIKQDNRGLPSARNTGIKNSTGELIAFLDSDDLWYPNKVEEQVKYFEKHKDVYLIHTAFNMLIGDKIYPRPLKLRLPILNMFYSLHVQGHVYDRIILNNFIGVLTVMIKREAINEVGYFDETMWTGEDWDLWIRVSKKYKIGFINKPLAVYRYNIDGMSKNIEKWANAVKNVINKHYSAGNISYDKYYKVMLHFNVNVGLAYCLQGNHNEFKKRLKLVIKSCPFSIISIKCIYIYIKYVFLRYYRRVFSKK